MYHYDESGNLIAENGTDGVISREYLWLGKQRIAYADNASGGVLYFIHTDHLDTPQLLTDSNGAIAWRADYRPFGEVAVDAASTVAFNLRLPGQYYDQETSLHYNYFRDYDPSIGRYVENDPVGLRGGLNSYVYAMVNPVVNLDVYGLNPLQKIAEALELFCKGVVTLADFQGIYDRGIKTVNDAYRDKLDRSSKKAERARIRCMRDYRNCVKESGACPISPKHPCEMGLNDCLQR